MTQRIPTDPYRSAGGHACPQCGAPLDVPTGGPIACPSGCGEWLPRTFVDTMFDLDELSREPHGTEQAEALQFAPPPCPTCSAPLVRAWLGAAPVRVCAPHGIWIATASHSRFEAQLAEPMERNRRMIELVELLAASDLVTRRQLAKRFIALEDRVAALEAALRDRT